MYEGKRINTIYLNVNLEMKIVVMTRLSLLVQYISIMCCHRIELSCVEVYVVVVLLYGTPEEIAASKQWLMGILMK